MYYRQHNSAAYTHKRQKNTPIGTLQPGSTKTLQTQHQRQNDGQRLKAHHPHLSKSAEVAYELNEPVQRTVPAWTPATSPRTEERPTAQKRILQKSWLACRRHHMPSPAARDYMYRSVRISGIPWAPPSTQSKFSRPPTRDKRRTHKRMGG